MGQGAKSVSNLLMEVVAGKNRSMTDTLMLGNANHCTTYIQCSSTAKTGQEKTSSECECFGNKENKSKRI